MTLLDENFLNNCEVACTVMWLEICELDVADKYVVRDGTVILLG
jgi:hypothetical protein